MSIKSISQVLIISFVSLSAFAQIKRPGDKPLTKEEVSEAKKQAGEFYKIRSYQQAVPLYKKIVVAESQNTEINYRLGYCLLNSNSDKSTAVEYLEFASRQKDAPKDVQYWLGLANLHALQFDAAIKAFDDYKAAMKGKPDPKLMVDRCIEWVYNAKALTASPLAVKFENLGKGINSAWADYRPIASVDDSIVFFATSRKGTTGNQADEAGEFFSDVFYFTQTDSGRAKAKNIGMNINSEFYEEPAALASTLDELYIYKETPEFNGDIFVSQLKGKSFQKCTALSGEQFATREYEYGAAISPDGQWLVYSSDKKNKDKSEKGGRDLYICQRNQNGTWSEGVNIGNAINTAFDEDFPFFFSDGKTLFFASKGHSSMGGYDIFMSNRPDENSAWSSPVNIGYPLNTTDDDKYFVLNPDTRTGYVSQVRDSGLGNLDIYRFTLENTLLNASLCVIKANVVVEATGAISKNARITITKKGTGTTMGDFFTNSTTGGFMCVLPPGEYDVAIRTEKMGKFDDALTVPENTNKIYKSFVLKQ